MRRQIAALKAKIEQAEINDEDEAKPEPTYLLDCVLPPRMLLPTDFWRSTGGITVNEAILRDDWAVWAGSRD